MGNAAMFWEKTGKRFGELLERVRAMVPNCPYPWGKSTPAEAIHQVLKAYQGDGQEVLYFAGMEPMVFNNVFIMKTGGMT